MTTHRMSRRKWLLGTGAAALALPYLPSLMGESRAAPQTKTAKRFIFFMTTNGQQPDNWQPNEPAAWTVRSQDQFVREADLTQYQGGLSPVLGPEFDQLLPK